MASMPVGSTGVSRLDELVLADARRRRAPGCSSTSPGLPSRYCCGVGRVKPVKVDAAQAVGAAEGGDADDRAPRPGRASHDGRVADVQVAVLGGAAVDDDLAGLGGARPSARRYGLSAGSSIQLPARVGGPLPPMRLAVGAEELAVALDVGRGGGDAGDLLDGRRPDRRRPAARDAAGLAGAGRCRRRCGRRRRCRCVGVAEQRVEAGAQRVAEDERAGEERDAEDHREERAGEAPLVGAQRGHAQAYGGVHDVTPKAFMRSSTPVGGRADPCGRRCGRRRGRRPGRRRRRRPGRG